MLDVLLNLIDDPAAAEHRLLHELTIQGPELPEWSEAVKGLLNKLKNAAGISRVATVRVLNLPIVNALALPHQSIVLSAQLVKWCEGKSGEMAFVIAHELAHIHLGHSRDRSRLNAMLSLGSRAAGVLGFGLRALFDRAYSREQELDADRHAALWIAAAGYDVRSSAAFLERLQSLTGDDGALELLRTHPPFVERIENVRKVIDQWGG